MEAPCPACTSILDALNGNADDLAERMSLAVVAKSPLPRILAHARTRGWRRHNRCTDSIWPLWNVLDLTSDGRGDASDFPRLRY